MTASPIPQLGVVWLSVDTSGAPAPAEVVITREDSATADPIEQLYPDGYLASSGQLALVNGSAVFVDTTCPLDTPVTYTGTVPGGASTTTSAVTLDSDRVWRLGSPELPYLDVALPLSVDPPHCPPAGGKMMLSLDSDATSGQDQTEQVPGSRYPLVAHEPATSRTFGLRVAARGQTDTEQLELLLAEGRTVLLRSPSGYAFGSRYALVMSTSVDRLVPDHRRPWRVVSAVLRELERPVVSPYGTLGARWEDLCAVYPTWAAMAADSVSWASLVSGVAGGPLPSGVRTWDDVDTTWASWAALTATGYSWSDVLRGP